MSSRAYVLATAFVRPWAGRAARVIPEGNTEVNTKDENNEKDSAKDEQWPGKRKEEQTKDRTTGLTSRKVLGDTAGLGQN